MALVTTPALILQAFAYGDTSKILRLYCRTHGLRSVIAKGATRPRSRFGGVLEPFTEGEATFYAKEGRDLHTLSGFDLLRSRQTIGRDFGSFAGASLISEMVLRGGTEDPSSELYDTLLRVLDAIAAAPPGQGARIALAGVWQTVALLGFQPFLGGCIHCGRVLDADEPSRVDVQAGGAACFACRPAGRVVEAEARAELAGMLAGTRLAGSEQIAVHRALLHAYLAAHLLPEHPLRSLDLFLSELQ